MSRTIEIHVRRSSRAKPLRVGVESVGWLSLAFGGFIYAYGRWPRFGCRVLGHTPSAWTWSTDTHEETSCHNCGDTLTRERNVKTERVAA